MKLINSLNIHRPSGISEVSLKGLSHIPLGGRIQKVEPVCQQTSSVLIGFRVMRGTVLVRELKLEDVDMISIQDDERLEPIIIDWKHVE